LLSFSATTNRSFVDSCCCKAAKLPRKKALLANPSGMLLLLRVTAANLLFNLQR
jgi:hypothetical protein